jgi:hypothetical protein
LDDCKQPTKVATGAGLVNTWRYQRGDALRASFDMPSACYFPCAMAMVDIDCAVHAFFSYSSSSTQYPVLRMGNEKEYGGSGELLSVSIIHGGYCPTQTNSNHVRSGRSVISLKLRFGIATPKDNIWTHRDQTSLFISTILPCHPFIVLTPISVTTLSTAPSTTTTAPTPTAAIPTQPPSRTIARGTR